MNNSSNLNNKVNAHLAIISRQKGPVRNPCSEILLDEIYLIEPKNILFLQLAGCDVFDLTHSLGLPPEIVNKDQCYQFK